MVTESQIRDQIYSYLKARGIVVWRDRQPTKRPLRGTFVSSEGLPDIMGVLKGGKFLGIEVKKPGGRISEAQQDFIDSVMRQGGICFVAYSVDDVIRILNDLY